MPGLYVEHLAKGVRRIRLSTSSRNGQIRERLEVLRLVGGDDACVSIEVGYDSVL